MSNVCGVGALPLVVGRVTIHLRYEAVFVPRAT